MITRWASCILLVALDVSSSRGASVEEQIRENVRLGKPLTVEMFRRAPRSMFSGGGLLVDGFRVDGYLENVDAFKAQALVKILAPLDNLRQDYPGQAFRIRLCDALGASCVIVYYYWELGEHQKDQFIADELSVLGQFTGKRVVVSFGRTTPIEDTSFTSMFWCHANSGPEFLDTLTSRISASPQKASWWHNDRAPPPKSW